MDNILTIDVEEWFQAHRLCHSVGPAPESRVLQQVEDVLGLLAEFSVSATFFVVGQVAAKFPDMVNRISEAGHEIASHGYSHIRIDELDSEACRKELELSKQILEDITCKPVVGFRAPSWSIPDNRQRYFDLLLESGYRYDSSSFRYGWCSEKELSRNLLSEKNLVREIAGTTWSWQQIRFPFNGGFFFRILPYALVKSLMKDLNRRGTAVVFYLHPWELDELHPRVRVDPLSYFIHYANIGRTQGKFRRLLCDFSFTSIEHSYFSVENENSISPSCQISLVPQS